jgi:membrane dipeptidase
MGFLTGILFTVLLLSCGGQVAVDTETLHRDSIVWDCHNDLAARELRAISAPIFQKVPPIEDMDLRIAVEHLSQGREWPLEGKPSVEDLVDHIDHAVKIAGVDHVGLGADMYPRTPSPEGIRGAQDYPNITKVLKKRGYSDEDIKKIMGGNFLRLWKAVTDK